MTNKLRINNGVSWNLTVQNWTFSLACTDPYIGIGWEYQSNNKTTNNFQFEYHLEARTRLDNLKKIQFPITWISSSQMHMQVKICNFWKTEVDLIIPQWFSKM